VAVGQWSESWVDGTTSPDVQTQCGSQNNAAGSRVGGYLADGWEQQGRVRCSVVDIAVLVQ
jgi:hypothetical protein